MRVCVQIDVLGCPFSSIVHPEDVAILTRELNIGGKMDKAAGMYCIHVHSLVRQTFIDYSYISMVT
jgi:hypothetical protein